MSHLVRPAGAAVLLVLAVVLLPAPVASMWSGDYADPGDLRTALGSGLADLWATGTVRPSLERPVTYWAGFHVVKAALSALLLLALVALCARLAAAYAGPGRRRMLAGLAGVLVSALAFVALLSVLANLQGAVAPLSSALGLVPGDPTLARMRDALTAGRPTPATEVVLHDFVRYHAAMAVLAGVATSALVLGSLQLGRRRARTDRQHTRSRRALATATSGLALAAVFFGVVTAANLSTVRDPDPALAAFLDGGL